MISPGKKTNGGISKIIEYYQGTNFWKEYKIIWIETHCTGSTWEKLIVLLLALITFLKHVCSAEIAHIHFSGKTSAKRKNIFFMLSKIFHLKILSHVHSPTLNISELDNLFFRNLIKYSDQVIVLSPTWAKVLKRLVNRSYIVLNNPSKGISKSTFQKEKLVLFAGKLEDRKGYIDLLDALNLAKIPKDYKVILAGDGDVDKAKSYIIKNSLENVIAIGWQEEPEITNLYERAAIFVLPSYGEGFPMSIISALCNRCAIITTPVGGIPDLLNDGETCFFVEPGDVDGISRAIEVLINEDATREFLSNNGYQLAMRTFDIYKITSELSKIYKSLLSSRPL